MFSHKHGQESPDRNVFRRDRWRHVCGNQQSRSSNARVITDRFSLAVYIARARVYGLDEGERRTYDL